MEHNEAGARPIDLEAIVAKNVRRLREGRGISQQQLGNDLSSQGVGMHQTSVAKLEAGAKPLRLNEVAAISTYFGVPVESLWEGSGEILSKHERANLTLYLQEKEREMARASHMMEEAAVQVLETSEVARQAQIRAAEANARHNSLRVELELSQYQLDAIRKRVEAQHGQH